MSDMFELDPTVREFVDRVARKVLASADFSEPLEVTIEDIGERTYRVIFHRGDEIKRLRAENTALAAERDRAERILAALREPSEGMMESVLEEYGPGQFVAFHRTRLVDALNAAVAAAEEEVGDA